MATASDIINLRRVMPTEITRTDEELSTLIDETGSIDAAAALLWRERASQLSTLVDVSESGSSRSLGSLYKNAIDIAKFYQSNADALLVVDTTARTRTRPVVRA